MLLIDPGNADEIAMLVSALSNNPTAPFAQLALWYLETEGPAAKSALLAIEKIIDNPDLDESVRSIARRARAAIQGNP